MMKLNYAIYPSMLDSFDWFLKSRKHDAFQELIDKINRVEKPKSLAMEKGIVFEDLVYCIKNPDDRKYSLNDLFRLGLDRCFGLAETINKKLGEEYYKQEYIQTVIKRPEGNIKLYGYLDARCIQPRLVDIKTTAKYSKGKFKNNWQHRTYLEIEDRNKTGFNQFTYLATDFKNIYEEHYEYDVIESFALYDKISEFIGFLEENRELITDRKIFGGEK